MRTSLEIWAHEQAWAAGTAIRSLLQAFASVICACGSLPMARQLVAAGLEACADVWSWWPILCSVRRWWGASGPEEQTRSPRQRTVPKGIARWQTLWCEASVDQHVCARLQV